MNYVESYISSLIARNCSPFTIKRYGQELLRFSKFVKTDLLRVKEKEVAEYLTRPQFKTVGTRRTTHAILKAFYQYLASEFLILCSPLQYLPAPRNKRALPSKIMSVGETQKVLEKAKLDEEDIIEYRNRLIMELCYNCSLRRSEVIALNVKDFEAGSKAVVIRHSKNRHGRIVPTGDYLGQLLETYIAEIRPRFHPKDKEALFLASNHKGRLSGNTVTNLVTGLRRRSKIRTKATSHSFRKSSATHMLRNGAPLIAVQQLLGHQRPSSTTVYTKVYPMDLVRMLKAHHPREKQKNLVLPELKVPTYRNSGKKARFA